MLDEVPTRSYGIIETFSFSIIYSSPMLILMANDSSKLVTFSFYFISIFILVAMILHVRSHDFLSTNGIIDKFKKTRQEIIKNEKDDDKHDIK